MTYKAWMKDHPLWSVRKKDQIQTSLPQCDHLLRMTEGTNTWIFTRNAIIFASSKRIVFHNSGGFLGWFFPVLFFSEVSVIAFLPIMKLSVVSLLWFKWFMTHSLIVVCYTAIVISIICYVSHFLCSCLLQRMILTSLHICLSSFCSDDDQILYQLNLIYFYLKHLTALLFTLYWALQASPVDHQSSLKFYSV